MSWVLPISHILCQSPQRWHLFIVLIWHRGCQIRMLNKLCLSMLLVSKARFAAGNLTSEPASNHCTTLPRISHTLRTLTGFAESLLLTAKTQPKVWDSRVIKGGGSPLNRISASGGRLWQCTEPKMCPLLPPITAKARAGLTPSISTWWAGMW